MRLGTRGSAAGARPGAPGGRAASETARDRPHDRHRATAASGRATRRAGSPSSRRRCCAGEIDLAVHSAKDVPGELRRGPGDRGRPGRARTPATRCAARRRWSDLPAGRAGGDEQPAAALRSCWPPARTSRSPTCAATSTRGCASWPRANGTRSCSPGRGPASAWAAPKRRAAPWTPRPSCPLPGRARSPSRPARTTMTCAPRSPGSTTPTAARLPARGARPGGRAGRDLPHPGRRPRHAGRRGAAPARVGGAARRHARGLADERSGPADDPASLGREVAARLLAAGAGELLERAEALA